MLIVLVNSLLSTITSPMRAVENNYNLNSKVNSEKASLLGNCTHYSVNNTRNNLFYSLSDTHKRIKTLHITSGFNV